MNPIKFETVSWAAQTNLYEVNLRQYSEEGTLKAFSTHLPRLKDMGVETLWFMPITPISEKGRLGSLGSYYACSDYTSVNPEFGTLADFKKLVKQAHTLGMKVIIDWVANHTGLDHVWTKQDPGFYKQNAEGEFYDTNGWKDVIDLNYYSGPMRKAMIEAMAFWIKEADIDGFRCDMSHLVPLDFWRQARLALDPLKKLYWLAETEDVHYLDVFDTCYAWSWMHETESYCKGNSSLMGLKSVLERYQKEFPAHTTQLYFTSNHDENSWNGTEQEKYGPLVNIFAIFSVLWRGLPLIYSGQELPNQKRLKFFDKDPIDWNQPASLHGFYKTLLEFKSSHPALSNQIESKWIQNSEGDRVLSFSRTLGNESILVLLNFSYEPQQVSLYSNELIGNYRSLFNGQSFELDGNKISLEGYAGLVLVKN
jgi:glycosidase